MRVTLLGLPVDILSRDETLARALDAMRSRRRCQHVALNVAKLVGCRTDADLKRDVAESDIVGIDGMGILYALRLLGHRAPHRVAGIDMFEALIAACAQEGFRPFLLGAAPAVLEQAERTLVQRHPGLTIAGRHHGYFNSAEEDRIAALIQASGADCLFIAMPTPRKERFLHRYRDSLGVPFCMGVGGSFDVVAGLVRRAPPVWRKLGLEWLFRLLQEPRRMFWRYARSNAIFAGLLVRVIVARALRSEADPQMDARRG
jgi:N-acetylglucosaminyldiphosphoundecaprenol N-acetyl-beta-D-mannosaminyltransferase